MNLLKKVKTENKLYITISNNGDDIEIVCDAKGKIISLGIKNDIQISPEDIETRELEKYQEFCDNC